MAGGFVERARAGQTDRRAQMRATALAFAALLLQTSLGLAQEQAPDPTQDPNQGWDGTFKGVPQPVETYLWIAEGIDENGRKIVQKGMTSLVR